jgi:hypothetical protein
MMRCRYLLPVLFLGLSTLSAPAADEAGLKITLNKGTIEVAGLDAATAKALADLDDARWRKLFAVHVAELKDPPAMLGTYRIEAGVVRFEPRFPLQPGLRYRAVWDAAQLPDAAGPKRAAVVFEFALPKPPSVPTRLVQVYPTTNKLPENQLKFYLHFSAPMSRGEAYRHIHLIDARGKEVDLPFLELDEELWDPAGKRFTLFFDPGRIKRGLKPREEFGPALEEGKSYTLVIDRGWRDAQGNPLTEAHRKAFSVGAPDDAPVDPKAWKLAAPAAGTTAPLTVEFPESLDQALLERLLRVTDAGSRTLAGKVVIDREETRWKFTPDQPWQAGTHALTFEAILEDLAGNSIGRPFEVDVFRTIQKQVKPETLRIPFEVR